MMCFKSLQGETVVLMACAHTAAAVNSTIGAVAVCQLNVAQQLLITEEHLSHLRVPLLRAILVDFLSSLRFLPVLLEPKLLLGCCRGEASTSGILDLGIKPM